MPSRLFLYLVPDMMILFYTESPDQWLAKAEQLGLFDMPVHVAASVDKHGHFRAAHIAKRKVRAHKPEAPKVSADLFGGADGDAGGVPANDTAKKAKKLAKFLAKHGGAGRMAATLKEMTPEQRAKLIDAMAHLDGLTVSEVHDLLGMADHGLDTAKQDAVKPNEAAKVEPVAAAETSPSAKQETGAMAAETQETAGQKADEGPNEGDRNADGLVFRGGRWHREDEPTDSEMVEYTTKKGKVLRGIVRTDISGHEAKAIDPYTFRYQGGWFIREKHLDVSNAVAGSVSGGADGVTSATASAQPQEMSPEEKAKAEAAARAERAKKQAAKLREIAEKTIGDAQAEQNRDRQTNTARRANMAGHALQRAAANEAIGHTLKNLADAIESGEAQHLSGVTSRAAVESLDQILKRAMFESDRGLGYHEQQQRKGRPPEPTDIMRATLPVIDLNSYSRRSNLLEKLKGKRGGKALADKIRYAPELTPEYHDELKKLIHEKDLDDILGWWGVEAMATLKRFKRMGIEDNNALRMALTEYVMFRTGAKKPDPVKQAEMALVGQKVGIDFFPTPKPLAERMAELAGVTDGMRVLEPSAGNGNLADAAKAAGATVDTYEVSSTLRDILNLKGHNVAGHDFMEAAPEPQYDAVIMNPPFSNRMDADHIQHAWGMLKPGGRLVAIAGEGVFFGSDKKAQAFRDWLDENGADVEQLPAGTFLDKNLPATTGVNARLIVMEKPAQAASATGESKAADPHVELAEAKADLAEAVLADPSHPDIPVLAAKVAEKHKATQADEGPKDGDRNADGLVFRNGRWHREDDQQDGGKRDADFENQIKVAADGVMGWDKADDSDDPWASTGRTKPQEGDEVFTENPAMMGGVDHVRGFVRNGKVFISKVGTAFGDVPSDRKVSKLTSRWTKVGEESPYQKEVKQNEARRKADADEFARHMQQSKRSTRVSGLSVGSSVFNGEGTVLVTSIGDSLVETDDGRTYPVKDGVVDGLIAGGSGMTKQEILARMRELNAKEVALIHRRAAEQEKFGDFDSEMEKISAEKKALGAAYNTAPEAEKSPDIELAEVREGQSDANGGAGWIDTDDKQGATAGAEQREEPVAANDQQGGASVGEAANGQHDGPKEGERNADGLVFRNGRWHRDDSVSDGMAANSADNSALVDYAKEMAGKADSKRRFFDAVIGRFSSEDTSNEHRQALFDALGLPKGAKVDDFRAALDSYYDDNKGERKKRHLNDKQALAESNVRKVMQQAKEVYQQDRAQFASNDGDSSNLSDDPNSPNYRFRDTGYIAGSRKEQAAQMLRDAAKTGRRVNVNEVDWEQIEQNPREAKELITKSNLFGQVPWENLKEQGMEPATGFLIDRVYASLPKEPSENSPQARKDYALGLQTLRERLEKCKTPSQVTDILAEIREERRGVMMNAEESAEYAKYHEAIMSVRGEMTTIREEIDHAYDAMRKAEAAARDTHYKIENRKKRGWKPLPELDAQLKSERMAADAANQAWRAVLHLNRPKEAELKEKASDLRSKAMAVQERALKRNQNENAVHRAWNVLGDRFAGVLNYRSQSGSASFRDHVTAANGGKVKDWSWAESTGPTKAPRVTKKEVRFQMRVAETMTRKGGRAIKVDSTLALKSAFGLRDVQSGNWVLKDPAAAKFHVENCAMAFADLADIFGVPDEQVSLNGRLAMAFGARGSGAKGWADGAPKAHYESVQRVINLTKMGGGGSLAHEWAHALDNIVKEAVTGVAGDVRDFASENPDILPEGELRDAFRAVRSAMLDGNEHSHELVKYSAKDFRLADYNINSSRPNEIARMIKAAGDLDSAMRAVNKYFERYSETRRAKVAEPWRRLTAAYYDRNPEGSAVLSKSGKLVSSFAIGAQELDAGGKPYWSETHEMFARAFHAYVEDKLADQNRENGYLASYGDNKYHFDRMTGMQWKPFPEGEERKRINAAFDKLVEAVRKHGVLAKAMALFGAPPISKVMFFGGKAA